MFNWVENMLLTKGLKYWGHSCSQLQIKLKKYSAENMWGVVFENGKGRGVYVEAAVQSIL